MKQKIKENRFVWIAFFVPFGVMGLSFILHEFFPFGDNQILIVDLWHQYFPFLNELREKLIHGGSLLYSWNIGMGTNFLGLSSYYASSPLNLLLVLAPEKYLVVGLGLLVLIRMGLASAFFALFLKKIYNRNHFTIVLFGAAYGLSGFFLGYYWNVMWLDTAALLPLVALGIHQLVRRKDFRLYVIALCLSLFSNYYMGLFTCIFCGLYYFGACLQEKRGIKETLTGILRMLAYSAIGIAMSAILLLPAWLCLRNTYYASSSFPASISFFYTIPELIQKMFAFTEPSYVEGAPNLYSGLFVLPFATIFFSIRRIALKEKIYFALFLIFLLLSCNMNVLDFIWHGFHYTNMVPHRFVFLFTFLVAAVAYRGYLAVRKTDLFDTLAMFFASGLLLALGFFQLEKKIWLANGILFLIYVGLVLLFKKRLMKWKPFVTLAALVLLVEYVLCAYIAVDTAGDSQFSTYRADNEAVEELFEEIEETEGDSEFYRMEFASPWTLNDAALFGNHGITCFSSMCNSKLSYVLEKLGLAADDGSNRYAYKLGSPVIDSFFNIKYLITREGAFKSGTWSRKSSSTHLVSYQNDYALPLGFMTREKILDTDIEQINPFTVQNQLFSYATGIREDIFDMVELTESEATYCALTVYDDESYYMESDNWERDGEVRLYFDVEEGSDIYAYVTSNLGDTVQAYGTGESKTIRVEYPCIDYLKQMPENGTRSFVYKINAGELGDSALYVRSLNKDVLKKGYEELADEPLTVTHYTDTRLKGTVAAKEDGYLFTSIPYEKGWSLYVDGKKTEIEPFKDAFIGVRLSQGEHEIRLEYAPEGFLLGCILSGAAVLLFVILCVVRRKKGLKSC